MVLASPKQAGEHLTHKYHNLMNMKYSVTALAIGAMMLASCDTMNNAAYAPHNSVGVATQSFPATVIAARNVTIDSSDTSRNVGTGLGAVIGAGAGQLLGKGKGRAASTLGFAAAGALAGRALGDLNTTEGQTLTVQVNGGKQTYTVTQPIYKQYGPIPVGAQGTFELGGSNSRFVPYGM